MNEEKRMPADEVVPYLRSLGIYRSSERRTLEAGQHQNKIVQYVSLIEAGDWYEGRVPIKADRRSGTVWKGGDRTAALCRVDWDKARKAGPMPMVKVLIQHIDREPQVV